MSSPLPQARLYVGKEMLALRCRQEREPLEAKLINALERSLAWTHADIIDAETQQMMFQARKVSRWGVRLVLEKRFPTGEADALV